MGPLWYTDSDANRGALGVCMALYIKPCGYSIERLHDRNMAQDSFVMKKSTARATDSMSSA